MSRARKTTIRTLTTQILEVYESIASIEDVEKRFRVFIESLKSALRNTAIAFEAKELSQFTGASADIDTAYAFKFQIEGSSVFSFTISFASCNDYITLISTLKQFIASGKDKTFFILEENQLITKTYNKSISKKPQSGATQSAEKLPSKSEDDKNKPEIKARDYYRLCPLPPDDPLQIENHDDDALYDALILDGTMSDTQDFSIVDDFFLNPPETFSHFIRSTLIHFHLHNDGFGSIRICKTCQKIFLPERSGDERGLFCTTKCQKSYYDRYNRIFNNCHQNQMNRIQTMRNFIEKSLDNRIKFDSPNPISAVSKCRNCIAVKEAISNNTRIKAGMCPILLSDSNFQKLSEEYDRLKLESKNDKKKSKKKVFGVEEYSVSDDINSR